MESKPPSCTEEPPTAPRPFRRRPALSRCTPPFAAGFVSSIAASASASSKSTSSSAIVGVREPASCTAARARMSWGCGRLCYAGARVARARAACSQRRRGWRFSWVMSAPCHVADDDGGLRTPDRSRGAGPDAGKRLGIGGGRSGQRGAPDTHVAAELARAIRGTGASRLRTQSPPCRVGLARRRTARGDGATWEAWWQRCAAAPRELRLSPARLALAVLTAAQPCSGGARRPRSAAA